MDASIIHDPNSNIVYQSVIQDPLDRSMMTNSFLREQMRIHRESEEIPAEDTRIKFPEITANHPPENVAVEKEDTQIYVAMSTTDIWSLWYENGGLAKLKIEEFFTGFRLAAVYTVTSIPFWVSFNRSNHDISDAVFSINLLGLWIYYTVTFFIMAWFMIRSSYKKIDTLLKHRDFFDDNRIDIETTEGIDIDKMAQICHMSKEDFLLEACKRDNVLLALEDKKFIDSPLFTNLLGTRPLEIALKMIIDEYYFKKITWTFDHRDGNCRKFSDFSKRCAIVFIPFIPTVIVFSVINHIFTYIHNGSYLSLYDYNRVGLWKFRYYNEFFFQAKKRLSKTKSSAESITVNLFLESWRSSIFKCVSYILSAFSGTLIVFSFFGYEWIWGMDVITISATCGILSTWLFPKPRNQDGSMTALRNALKNDLTRYELGDYFESKLWILLKEILSILYLPISLYFIVPSRSYFIADFFHTYYKNNKCVFPKQTNLTPKTKASSVFMHTSLSSDLLINL